MMSLQPEAVVKHYVIKDLIARGGMGEVWRAWDIHNKCFVAIKAVAADLLDDPQFKTRFCDELSRHSRLSNPHIAQVLDTFEQGGQVCCVMQLIEGQSLAKYLKSRGRLSVEESIPILQEVLGALDYAHRKGIVHRDIKPSNILLDSEHRAYLIDFGIALAIGEKRRTRTGVAIGTPLYMSPEQIVRPQSLDHRTDVYSLGCVLYEMLTGRPPFLADRESGVTTDMAIKEAHVKQVPVPPSRRAPGISPAMDRLVLWALEKNPENRLPGCREFSRLLAEPAQSEVPFHRWQFKNFLPNSTKKILPPILIFIFAFALFYLLLRLLGF